MEIIHKIRNERFYVFVSFILIYKRHYLLQYGVKPGPSNSNKRLKSENRATWSKQATEIGSQTLS